jgi:hypothetical protein
MSEVRFSKEQKVVFVARFTGGVRVMCVTAESRGIGGCVFLLWAKEELETCLCVAFDV